MSTAIDSPAPVCGFALGRGRYCHGHPRFPLTHATACPHFTAWVKTHPAT